MPRHTTKGGTIVTAEPNARHATFDEMFRAAARRVLKRRGVPDSRIEAEIARLRKAAPAFDGPDFDEFMTADATGADKR
jgi:hypothetical protein